MKTTTIKYVNLSVLCCAVMIFLVQVVNANILATSTSPVDFVEEPNLNNEVQTIESFRNDFASYNKRGFELSKKPAVANQEFAALESAGNNLKQRVSEVREALLSINRKLKAAGRWDNLDEEILATLPADDRAYLQKNGGLRRVLEDSAAQLDSQAADGIVAPLSRLRSKVAANTGEFPFELRMVAARYEAPNAFPPASVFTRSMGCILATAHYAANLVIGGGQLNSSRHGKNKELFNNASCLCNGNNCLAGDTSIMVW